MPPPFRSILLAVGLVAGLANAAAAQTFDTVGTRAAGMGGAFVAVADDASAAYWNPGGFASGNYFTMVLDRRSSRVDPQAADGGTERSGVLVALGMPAIGLSYYRLQSATLRPARTEEAGAGIPPAAGPEVLQLDMLVTHHSGVTLVQSVARGVAIGTTLKLVRGIAATSAAPDGDRDALLSAASELDGRGSTKFDADVGVMATAGALKAGLTIRNLTEPEFRTGSADASISLRRQARAGIAIAVAQGWAVAADVDVTRRSDETEHRRQLAIGTEGRIGRKAFVRTGLNLNTTGPRRPALAAGASYAVLGSVLIDAEITGGSERAARGWGIAARFVY